MDPTIIIKNSTTILVLMDQERIGTNNKMFSCLWIQQESTTIKQYSFVMDPTRIIKHIKQLFVVWIQQES